MRSIDTFVYDNLLPQNIKQLIHKNEDRWQNFTDEELIRWVYIELGKMYSFDCEYRYARDTRDQTRIENEAKLAEKDGNLIRRISHFNSSKVICIDLVNAMNLVLGDLFGIDCKGVIDGSGPHEYNVVRFGNRIIRLDLQQDLYNIQSGRKTEFFGTTDYYDGKRFGVVSEDE